MLQDVLLVRRHQRTTKRAFPLLGLGANSGPVLPRLVAFIGDGEGTNFPRSDDLKTRLPSKVRSGVVERKGGGSGDGRQSQFGEDRIDDALHDQEGIQGGRVLR